MMSTQTEPAAPNEPTSMGNAEDPTAVVGSRDDETTVVPDTHAAPELAWSIALAHLPTCTTYLPPTTWRDVLTVRRECGLDRAQRRQPDDAPVRALTGRCAEGCRGDFG
jgi:hypothetical protein